MAEEKPRTKYVYYYPTCLGCGKAKRDRYFFCPECKKKWWYCIRCGKRARGRGWHECQECHGKVLLDIIFGNSQNQ